MMAAILFLLMAILAVVAVAAAMLAFGTADPPPPLTAVSAPAAAVDYSDLPPLAAFRARDDQTLTYRAYPARKAAATVVLVHGSAGESTVMHAAARALCEAGFSVFVPTLRGHGDDGRLGDIDYQGQLDDDLADLVGHLRQQGVEGPLVLAGHSAGGGLALRLAMGPYGSLFDRFVLLAPALNPTSPVFRPETKDWAVPFLPRFIVLVLLDKLGVHTLEGLPVIAFGVPEGAPVRLAPTYSYRLQRNFIAPDDCLARLGAVPQPMVVLVGADDELLFAARYAPLLHPARPGLPVTVLPGIGHMTLILDARALAALVAAVRG